MWWCELTEGTQVERGHLSWGLYRGQGPLGGPWGLLGSQQTVEDLTEGVDYSTSTYIPRDYIRAHFHWVHSYFVLIWMESYLRIETTLTFIWRQNKTRPRVRGSVIGVYFWFLLPFFLKRRQTNAGLTAWCILMKRLAVTHMSPWQLVCQSVRDWQLPQLGCKQQPAVLAGRTRGRRRYTVQVIYGISLTMNVTYVFKHRWKTGTDGFASCSRCVIWS